MTETHTLPITPVILPDNIARFDEEYGGRGYEARTFCLVDGFPAQVVAEVNTRKQEYSTYRIEVWTPPESRWVTVYEVGHRQVGDMPLYYSAFDGQPGNEDAVRRLQDVADRLHATAEVVARTARLRQDETAALAQITSSVAWAAHAERQNADMRARAEQQAPARAAREEATETNLRPVPIPPEGVVRATPLDEHGVPNGETRTFRTPPQEREARGLPRLYTPEHPASEEAPRPADAEKRPEL